MKSKELSVFQMGEKNDAYAKYSIRCKTLAWGSAR